TSKNSASAVYAPTDLDVRQWVRTARQAGMKYAVLTAKHTLGHCLWDSEDYDYDVATSTDTTDVVAEFMAACNAESIRPGIYYCVLDIHNEGGTELKWKAPVGPEYEARIKRHLTELHTNHPDIFEQWIDIPHKLSARQRWDIYRLIKKLNPDCLVIMNAAFKDGTEIPEGAWPTDLTNGEKTLPPPAGHEPVKDIDGREYYIPMEICDTVTSNWFWHPTDKPQSIRHLSYLYSESIRRGGNLLLNVSPDMTGQIPADQVDALMKLKKMIDDPRAFPLSIIAGAEVKASNVFQDQEQYGP
ncbi:MAG: alpha-L-fucosidase, partial [Planctomycetota bacterium]|nr:alpha-L-fucosidase [Planctomycetota bacterium]